MQTFARPIKCILSFIYFYSVLYIFRLLNSMNIHSNTLIFHCLCQYVRPPTGSQMFKSKPVSVELYNLYSRLSWKKLQTFKNGLIRNIWSTKAIYVPNHPYRIFLFVLYMALSRGTVCIVVLWLFFKPIEIFSGSWKPPR